LKETSVSRLHFKTQGQILISEARLKSGAEGDKQKIITQKQV
jgi:hypothetical protein